MKVIDIASFGIIPLMKEDDKWKVLLILHQEGSHWSFPKGRRQDDELPLQSALRELKEETGLDVDRLLQDTPLLETYKFRRKDAIVHKTVHYFPALVSGTLKLQEEEIRDARWLKLEDAPTLLTFAEARSLCRQVITLISHLL